MPFKLCPSCSSQHGPRRKKCSCGYVFISAEIVDNGSSLDSDGEIPERICAICKEIFYPNFKRTNSVGEYKWIWEYDIYCSPNCFHEAENALFNALLKIAEEHPELLSDEIKFIVTRDNFRLKNEYDSIDFVNFLRLSSPLIKNFQTANIKTPEDYEKVFDRKPPKKKTFEPAEESDNEFDELEKSIFQENQNEEQEIIANTSSEDLFDVMLEKVDNSLPAKQNLPVGDLILKPKQGQKYCKGCQAIIGANSKKCKYCDFKYKE